MDPVTLKPLKQPTEVGPTDQRTVNLLLSKEKADKRVLCCKHSSLGSFTKQACMPEERQMQLACHCVNLLDHVSLLPLAKNAMHLPSIVRIEVKKIMTEGDMGQLADYMGHLMGL